MICVAKEHPPDVEHVICPWSKFHNKGLLWVGLIFCTGALCFFIPTSLEITPHSFQVQNAAPSVANTRLVSLRGNQEVELPRHFFLHENQDLPPHHELKSGRRLALLRAAVQNISIHQVESSSVAFAMHSLALQWPRYREGVVDDGVVDEMLQLSKLLVSAAPSLSAPDVVTCFHAVVSLLSPERFGQDPTLLLEALQPAIIGVMERAQQADVLRKFSANQLVIVLWAIAMVRTQMHPEEFLAEEIVGRIHRGKLVEGLPTKDLATVLWSMARLNLRHEEIVTKIGKALVQPSNLPELGFAEIRVTLWALSGLNMRPPVVLSQIAHRIILPEVLHDRTLEDASILLWQLASLRVSDKEIIQPLCEHLKDYRVLNSKEFPLHSSDLSRTIAALAKVDYHDDGLLDLLAQRALSPYLFFKFTLSQIATFLWGFARLSPYTPTPTARGVMLVEGLKEHIIKELMQGTFPVNRLCTLSWSIGRLRYYDKELMDQVHSYVLNTPGALESLDIKEITQLIWSQAVLKAFNPVFTTALAFQLKSRPRLLEESGLRLPLLAFSFATLKHDDDLLFQRVLNQFKQAETAYNTPAEFMPQIIWAAASLKVSNDDFYQAAAQLVMDPKQNMRFNVHDIAIILWSYSLQGLPIVPMLVALADRLLSIIECIDHRTIGYIFWSYANLNMLHDKLMERLGRQAINETVLPLLHSHTIKDILWAHAVFDYRHPEVLDGLLHELATRPNILSNLRPHQLVKAMWAQGRLQYAHQKVMVAMFWRLVAEGMREPIDADKWANAVWALAQVEVGDKEKLEVTSQILKPEVLLSLTPAFITKLAIASTRLQQPLLTRALVDQSLRWLQPQETRGLIQFSVEDLASFSWAVATLKYHDPFLMLLVSRQLMGAVAELDMRTLLCVAWAFGYLQVDNTQFYEALKERADKPDIASTLSTELLWYIYVDWSRNGIRNKVLLDACQGLLQREEGTPLPNLAAVAWQVGWEERQQASQPS